MAEAKTLGSVDDTATMVESEIVIHHRYRSMTRRPLQSRES
jgi:hypothetical protein